MAPVPVSVTSGHAQRALNVWWCFRYLDSCTSPVTMKRKCESTSLTLSSNSEEDDQQKDHASCRASGGTHLLLCSHATSRESQAALGLSVSCCSFAI